MSVPILRILRQFCDNRCLFLCVLLSAILIGQSLAQSGAVISNLLILGFYLTMLFAPYFISRRPTVLKLSALGGIILLLPKILVQFHHDALDSLWLANIPLSHLTLSLLIFYEFLLMTSVLFYSLKKENPEPVSSCVLTYLLLGIFFGDLYFLQEQLSPGAFFSPTGTAEIASESTLLYFSFITLTSTGFGDVVPVHPFARTLAAQEAVMGVLYVALFIGRIIHIGSGREEKKNDSV